MASNVKKRLPSTKRDVVTGETLQHGTERIALTDRDMRRHPLHRTPIPFRLHISQQETVERDGTEGDLSERLGSNKLSGQLVHYISEGERSQARQEHEWWRNVYVCERLAQRIAEKGQPYDAEQFQVGLAWIRGEDLADSGYTDRYVKYAAACVTKLAKTYTPRMERAA